MTNDKSQVSRSLRQKIPKDTRESDIEKEFNRLVKLHRGLSSKLRWLDRRGAPDRFVAFKDYGSYFVELKRPGGKPRPEQIREHQRLKAHGITVYIVNDIETLEKFFEMVTNANKV